MIKPYYKEEHEFNIVEVEDYGVISLEDLPIRVNKEQRGLYQIDWVTTRIDGKDVKVLSEHGGSTGINYGGRSLGVIRQLS